MTKLSGHTIRKATLSQSPYAQSYATARCCALAVQHPWKVCFVKFYMRKLMLTEVKKLDSLELE